MRDEACPVQIDIHVGRRLAARRLFVGLSQQQLADAIGLTCQQVQKYESAANRVSASRLWAIAGRLQVDVAWFFIGLNDLAQAASPARPNCRDHSIVTSVARPPPARQGLVMHLARSLFSRRRKACGRDGENSSDLGVRTDRRSAS